MEKIELFLSLGYQKVEVNNDLMSMLGLPDNKESRQLVLQEVSSLPSNLSIDELKEKSTEAGFLDKFYEMTPADIELAYEGYIKRMYNLGNLFIIAERKSLDDDSEPFVYERPVTREETLNKLGLEDR